MSSQIEQCQKCGTKTVLVCGRCFGTYYCSEMCRGGDYAAHRPICEPHEGWTEGDPPCPGCPHKDPGRLACGRCLKAHYCSQKCWARDQLNHADQCKQWREQEERRAVLDEEHATIDVAADGGRITFASAVTVGGDTTFWDARVAPHERGVMVSMRLSGDDRRPFLAAQFAAHASAPKELAPEMIHMTEACVMKHPNITSAFAAEVKKTEGKLDGMSFAMNDYWPFRYYLERRIEECGGVDIGRPLFKLDEIVAERPVVVHGE